jgi:hypothetical protein
MAIENVKKRLILALFKIFNIASLLYGYYIASLIFFLKGCWGNGFYFFFSFFFPPLVCVAFDTWDLQFARA